MTYVRIGGELGIMLLCQMLGACGGGSAAVDGGGDSDSETDDDAGLPAGSLLWAQHLGGADYLASADAWHVGNLGHTVAALADGTFYAGGSFVNSAILGLNPENGIHLQSAGGEWDADAFIGRWKPNGDPDWAISIGGDEPDLMEPGELLDTVDGFRATPEGHLLAILSLEDGANLDPLGDTPVTLPDDNSGVVPSYDAQGHLVWLLDSPPNLLSSSSTHGAAYSSEPPFKVGADGSFIIARGPCSIPTTYGAGELNETTLTPSPGGMGISAIASYNSDTTLKWVVGLENGSPDLDVHVQEIAIGPDGEVVAAGYFDDGEAILHGVDGSETVLPWLDVGTDTTGHFVAKWSAAGEIEWVKQVPAVYAPSPFWVKEDGAIIWMDSFMDGWVFDPGGAGEVVIDQSSCIDEFCFFAVEITSDGSSFQPCLMDGGGKYIAMRADGSFALAGSNVVGGYNAEYEREWEATIVPNGSSGGAWIHDVAALADGSVVVIGDYDNSIVLGEGEPNETVLHGVCDECKYGAFLARYSW